MLARKNVNLHNPQIASATSEKHLNETRKLTNRANDTGQAVTSSRNNHK